MKSAAVLAMSTSFYAAANEGSERGISIGASERKAFAAPPALLPSQGQGSSNQAQGRARSRKPDDASRNRQPRRDRGSRRQALGSPDPALAEVFQHRQGPDAARDDRGLWHPQKGFGQRQSCRQAALRRRLQADRSGLRRDPGRAA